MKSLSRSARRVSSPVVLLALLGTQPASAAEPVPPTVIFAGVEVTGAPGKAPSRTDALLREAFARRADVRVEGSRDLRQLRFLYGCSDESAVAACLGRAREQLGAERLVFGTLKAGATGNEVTLRLLDLRAGAFAPAEVRETLRDEEIDGARTDRWLAALLGPAPAVTPVAAAGTPTTDEAKAAAKVAAATGSAAAKTPAGAPLDEDEVPWDDKPGRRLLAGGTIALVLAAAAFGVSIATWRAYDNAEQPAHDALAAVAVADPAYAASQADLFAHPSCAIPPTTGPAEGAVELYRSKCEAGESYASATRALVGTGAVLGAVGVAGVVLGALRARGSTAGSKPAAVLQLRAAPGGLALSF